MKCPKSKEFFVSHSSQYTVNKILTSEMHSADTVGVWHIILVIRLVLNYVMLSSLHLLHMGSAHTISTPMHQPCKHLPLLTQ